LTKQVLEYKKNWEKSKGIPQILRKYINGDGLKFIVFCENKEHLSEMQWLVEMWFVKAKFNARIRKYVMVSGSKANDKELDDFKSNQNIDEIRLLFTIDMLNEGVHISGISGVILLRTTQSPRIFYQQIGRAIETGNDSNQPLIFDFVNNFNSICADDFLMQLNIARENEKKLRDKLGLAENCPPFSIYDETKDEIEFFKSIEEKLANMWDYTYEQLKEYYKINGNCMVSRKHENKQLGYWVGKQRNFYNKGLLSQERIDKLNKLNFEWGPYEQWLLRFKDLEKYYKEVGTSDVPRRYKVNDFNLGQWTVWMRQLYRDGELSKDQIDLLNGIGFKWDMRSDRWDEMYEQLLEFKKEHGNCDVSRRLHRDTMKLATWVDAQRKNYKQGKLSDERYKKLNEIGFKFSFFDVKNRKSCK